MHSPLISSSFKQIFAFVTFAFAVYSGYNVFNKRRNKVENAPEKEEIHEVLMFSPDDTEIKKSKYSRVMITRNMGRLLFHIGLTQYSLDICMYVFTNLDLANAVLKLRHKGIVVRVIIDADMAYSSTSQVKRLEKYGIPVRWMKSTNIMHHKFCLRDVYTHHLPVTPVVIMGSLNWTNQGLSGNWEDVVVTSQLKLVDQYRKEFDRLWECFRPIDRLH